MKNFTLVSLLLIVLATVTTAQSSFYTQTFSTFPPTGWTNVDNTGNTAGTWKRVTTSGPLFTTRTGGYAIFNSDALGNDGKAEDASLISAAINCSTHPHVAIEFQSWFAQYQSSEGTFYVSNDNTNWVPFYWVSTSSVLNPEIVKIDISAVAANSPTVYLKFGYTGDNDYWWAVDDIKLFEPVALDISVTNVSNVRFVSLSDQTITGTVTNNGYTPVSNFAISYTDNAGAPVSQNISGLNLSIFQTYNFTLDQKVVMSAPALHSIIVTASDPNGGTDLDASNNSLTKEITALSALPEKNVMFEEFTTNQCGWCPAGHYIASQIEAAAPYFIPVNVHAGFGTDAMTTTEASSLAAAFANGAPTATIDRVYYSGQEKVAISRSIWQTKTTSRHAQISPASIDAVSTYEAGTRALSVTVTAKFYGPANGSFRVNCYVIEDSVSTTGSGYDQTNYLSGYNGYQAYPAYSMADPVVGYIHRHVERQALAASAWGTTGVVPASTADGGTYSKTYTTTLNASWNASRCKLVAFVNEYSSNTQSGLNEVFNVVSLPLNGSVSQSSTPSVYVSGIEEVANPISNLSIYPNPAADIATIEFNLKSESKISFDITDMLGQVVYSVPQVNLDKGGFNSEINTSNFANGFYLVSVKNNGKPAQTLKFVVSK